ncbi:hypothetical protein ElyMa_003525400 [Elysia marginata]|uniref:Uncharacterized protein n=1 Tax=Elysia marginata TaxID=1093978 RepID=A0AAV4EGN1_9GAST|nr:hypothetical protein ElyMa_003525400 [Elysia marginata]
MTSNSTPRSRSGTVASDDSTVVGFRYTSRPDDAGCSQDMKQQTSSVAVVMDSSQESGFPDRCQLQPVASPVAKWVMAQQQQQQQQNQKQQTQQQQQQTKQPLQLKLQPSKATEAAPLLLPGTPRIGLGVHSSFATSTVSLPNTGTGASLNPAARLYQPGNKSPLAAHRVTDSPGVLRRLVLSNSRAASPRPVSNDLSSPAAMRRPSSNPCLRSASTASSMSARVKIRRSSSRTSLASKGSSTGRRVRLTSVSSNREARTYSVSSGQYNLGFDSEEVDMESGFLEGGLTSELFCWRGSLFKRLQC